MDNMSLRYAYTWRVTVNGKSRDWDNYSFEYAMLDLLTRSTGRDNGTLEKIKNDLGEDE